MNKALWTIMGILLLAGIGILVWHFKWPEGKPQVVQAPPPMVKPETKQSPIVNQPNQYQIPRTLRYRFTLKNLSNRLLKQVEFWAFAPVKLTATQQVKRLEASHAHKVLTDHLGNQMLHFILPNIPPYATQSVTVTAQLMLAAETQPITQNHLTQFLGEEPFIEISQPKIQALASRLASKEQLPTNRQIFNWVAQHIRYQGYLRENRGALYALREKQGDCTEYMYLFIALARANQTPARGIGGYISSHDGLIKSQDYHNWAEFYFNNKWHLADPQNKVFMDQQSNYIAMRIISTQSKLSTSPRFWSLDKNLTIKMN